MLLSNTFLEKQTDTPQVCSSRIILQCFTVNYMTEADKDKTRTIDLQDPQNLTLQGRSIWHNLLWTSAMIDQLMLTLVLDMGNDGATRR